MAPRRADGAPHLSVVAPDGPPRREFAGTLLGRCAFPRPDASDTYPCAVSGGADSLALLVLAAASGLRPVAYHVDHGLRPGSAAEADRVRSVAEHLGAAAVCLAVEVAPGPNLEARARAARFAAMPPGVATGHTADDQAETVLLNLLRGASGAGLGAMAPGPRHPLLELRRSETRAVCREAGIEWFEDPSNSEPGPLRNRVRHDLLPRLEAAAGRDLVPVLCRQAGLLREDEAFLDELAGAIDATSAAALRDAPRPLARRAIRAMLREALGGGHPPGSAAVDRVLAVAAGEALACDVGQGISVRRRKGRLVVEATGPSAVR